MLTKRREIARANERTHSDNLYASDYKRGPVPTLPDDGGCPSSPCSWVLSKGYFKTVYVCEKCGDKIVV